MTPCDYELVAAEFPHLQLPKRFHLLAPQVRQRISRMSQDSLIAGRAAALLRSDLKPNDRVFVAGYELPASARESTPDIHFPDGV